MDGSANLIITIIQLGSTLTPVSKWKVVAAKQPHKRVVEVSQVVIVLLRTVDMVVVVAVLVLQAADNHTVECLQSSLWRLRGLRGNRHGSGCRRRHQPH